MEIFIDDIPEEGLTIKAKTEDDEWLLGTVRDALGGQFGEKDKASLIVTLIRFDDNVDVRGDVTIFSHPSCDRCLKTYPQKKTVAVHVLMAPLYETKKQEEEEDGLEKELVKEDFEFSYYEGDRIDLSAIIREQIVLDEPMKHLCREDCKGICQRCGKDLNEGPCGCVETHHDSRWDVLKGFKPKTGRSPKSQVRSQKK
jgi:uncharacterized protein